MKRRRRLEPHGMERMGNFERALSCELRARRALIQYLSLYWSLDEQDITLTRFAINNSEIKYLINTLAVIPAKAGIPLVKF
jgi:hypothetical protein